MSPGAIIQKNIYISKTCKSTSIRHTPEREFHEKKIIFEIEHVLEMAWFYHFFYNILDFQIWKKSFRPSYQIPSLKKI